MTQYNDYQGLERQLAHRFAATSYEEFTPENIRFAKMSIMDIIGVIIAGSGLGNKCRDVAEYVRSLGGTAESTLLGYGGRYPAAAAAMANGGMAHTLDYDDASENGAHGTASCFPAALALLEQRGGSGKDLISCVILGDDFLERFGWTSPDINGYGWLGPMIKGIFVSSLAGGRALQFSEEEMLNCLGFALTQACGSSECLIEVGNDIREIYQVFAQRAGVFSCELTRRGVTACRESLLGRFGFFKNYIEGKGNIDLSWFDFEKHPGFLNTATCYKPYSSCQISHTYIDAARAIMQQHGVTADQIADVLVEVGGMGVMLCTPEEKRFAPLNGNDARYNIPFPLGATFVYGKPSLKDFTPEGIRDPAIIDMARKVRWVKNDEVDAYSKNGKGYIGIVTVTCTDGRVYRQRCEHSLGTPGNPMSDEELFQKFQDCCRYAAKPMSEETVKRIFELCMHLEELADIRELTALLN